MKVVKDAVRRALPKGMRERIQAGLAIRDRLPDFRAWQEHVRGRRGLEIGGPSRVFRTILPLYQVVGELDGANFACETVWEGSLRPGPHFNFLGHRRGWQFISDATDLSGLPASGYDFLLSSNCLEHVANPLKALRQWRRVLRAGGSLVLVLPKKESNFDHRRAVTPFAHLLQDLERDVGEDDLTHLEEVMRLHDFSMDPLSGTPQQFRARSLKNIENRTLHHHVFDLPVATEMLRFSGFEVLRSHAGREDYFLLARKAGEA